MSCLFCEIAAGTLPATMVYEDDQALAFEDIHPLAPYHLLIVPRKHIPTINDLEPEDNALIGHLFQVAKTMAKKLNIDVKGYRTVINCNLAAGQTIFHVHLHLLGGRNLGLPG
jgi:histidine triad (HIT) family protein